MAKRGAPLGNKNAVGNNGKNPNWLKEACREAAHRIKAVEILEAAATEKNGKDKIKAIEMLFDRGFGKAEQSLDITNHDADRPSTDVLIQTITALRAELDNSRERIGLEKTK